MDNFWNDETVVEFAHWYKQNQGNNDFITNNDLWGKSLLNFWKKSKEVNKDYEILQCDSDALGIHDYTDNQYCPCDRENFKYCKIHSVKRFRDSQIFELHKTKVVDPNTNHEWVISEITQNKGTIYFNGVWINHVEVAKEPLFITSDGGMIYDNDVYYYVFENNDYEIRTYNATEGGIYNKEYTLRTFSKIDAAKEYILMNKPLLSLNDLLNAWDADEIIPTRKHKPDFYKDAPLFKNFQKLAKQKLNK